MPKYESETCEGCKFYESVADLGMGCMDPERLSDIQMVHSAYRCEHFTPSLECRKVLALETITTYVEYAHTEGWG